MALGTEYANGKTRILLWVYYKHSKAGLSARHKTRHLVSRKLSTQDISYVSVQTYPALCSSEPAIFLRRFLSGRVVNRRKGSI